MTEETKAGHSTSEPVPGATKEMLWKDFLAEGKRRYGERREAWRFVCPACGHVQSMDVVMAKNPTMTRKDVADWIFYSCEGRVDKSVGCNWTLGGLLHIHHRLLTGPDVGEGGLPVFLFEDETPPDPPFYTPREKSATKEKPHDG